MPSCELSYSVRLTVILLLSAIFCLPFTIADPLQGSCSHDEPQPIGIDFGDELMTAAYAHAADNITFLADVQSDVALLYIHFLSLLRLQWHNRNFPLKPLEQKAPPNGLFQPITAFRKQYSSKYAMSLVDQHTKVLRKGTSAVQYLSNSVFSSRSPLDGFVQEPENELTPESVQQVFVDMLLLLKEAALENNGISITFAVLSVPDFFNQTIMDLVRVACVEVGIETINPFARTFIGAKGANTALDARILIIDQGMFYTTLRTTQLVQNDSKPMLQGYKPLSSFGSFGISLRLVDRVLRSNEALSEQIKLGANRQQLQGKIEKARFLIKNDLDARMGKSPEYQHHDEWPLELKDWWIGKEQSALLSWEDVEDEEETWVEHMSVKLYKFLVSLRMTRENSNDGFISPEEVDVAVIMTNSMDGGLIQRALRRALGDHVEIIGGIPTNSLLAAKGAASSALDRLKHWEKTQRLMDYERLNVHKDRLDDARVSICSCRDLA